MMTKLMITALAVVLIALLMTPALVQAQEQNQVVSKIANVEKEMKLEDSPSLVAQTHRFATIR